MHKIGTLLTDTQAKGFASKLARCGIEHAFELIRTEEGERFGVIILNESDTNKAQKLLIEFERSPKNAPADPVIYAPGIDKKMARKSRLRTKRPVTIALFLICLLSFTVDTIEERQIEVFEKRVDIEMPIITPSMRWLMYDAPEAFELTSEFQMGFANAQSEPKRALSKEQSTLRSNILKTPYWGGFYQLLLAKFTGQSAPQITHPEFTKILEGEVWRFVTPCLLHQDLMHFVFNMIWLLALGGLIERRIGGRYLLVLIGASALFSNTGQYLMSGPMFAGLSGVACAMAGFIFSRKKVAPWEGYTVDTSVLWLFFGYIGILTALQGLFFILALCNLGKLTFHIGNTSHIVGFVTGLLIGRLNKFSWKVR